MKQRGPKEEEEEKRVSNLAIYVILSGWIALAIYLTLAIEVFDSETIYSHFLSMDDRGIRFRALVLFSPLIFTIIGYLVNEREKAMLGLERSDRKLRVALAEKETLLKEIHHRVKNNMAIISSLLSLQADCISDNCLKQVLYESKGRIKAMALLHNKLYHSEYQTATDAHGYISDVISNIKTAYVKQDTAIRFKIDSDVGTLDADKLISCGLIVNELVTNSLKYAFDDYNNAVIAIRLAREGSLIHMEVSDNGRGLPEGFNPATDGSLGLRLVRVLSEQLNGNMRLQNSNGLMYSVAFKH